MQFVWLGKRGKRHYGKLPSRVGKVTMYGWCCNDAVADVHDIEAFNSNRPGLHVFSCITYTGYINQSKLQYEIGPAGEYVWYD